MKNNKTYTPLFHLSRRVDVPLWQAWLIRGSAVVLALLVCAIVTACLEGGSFGAFFKYLFYGTFGTSRRILILFQDTAMLLIVALALTPAFKMKFWNIGGEGQVLMGALMAAVVMYFMGPSAQSNFAVIIVMLILSVIAGAIWAVIPAVFKAQWNTNETLFTLMMNYIAIKLVSFTVGSIATNGSGTLGIVNQISQIGWLPKVGAYDYILNIIVVAFLTVLLAVYLKYGKHGFEISVIGGSVNTAKYVGINVKKVIIRTMALSGALCGVAGFLLVSGTSHTVNADLAGGRGFTAILVSWLAQFNPVVMAITSFLVIFVDQGASQVATMLRFGTSFSSMITGIFFFFVIACEFFINYNVQFNFKKKKAQVSEVPAPVLDKAEESPEAADETAEEAAAEEAEGENTEEIPEETAENKEVEA